MHIPDMEQVRCVLRVESVGMGFESVGMGLLGRSGALVCGVQMGSVVLLGEDERGEGDDGVRGSNDSP
eukprot:2773669-Rhodomonas_salina.1